MSVTTVKPWSWGFYDFANSLANVAVSFYFVLWLVENLNGQDYWVSSVVVLSTVLLLAVLPPLGAHADRTGTHVRLLILCTMGSFAALALLGFVGMRTDALTTPSILLILFLYGCFQFFYQAGVNFYASLLRFVARQSGGKEAGISGIGLALGQLGNVAGLILALPVANAFGRPATFLSGAALFLVCSVPSLILLRRLKTTSEEGTAASTSVADVWRGLRGNPNVLRYLVGYCLFADAVLTLQLFLSLYLTTVAGLSDSAKTGLLALTLLVAAIGAACTGNIVRRFGAKRTIERTIIAWVALLVCFALARGTMLFVVAMLLNGLAFGLLFSASQAFYATLIPPSQQARYFGFYTIFERASSLVGPVLWSLVVLAFTDYGTLRYRLAVLSLALLVGLSFFFIRKVVPPQTSVTA